MRRWLLILLLVLLPVQFGSAALSQYGGHGASPVQADVHTGSVDASGHAPVQGDGCVPGDAHCHAQAIGVTLAPTAAGLPPGGNAYPPRAEDIVPGRDAPDIDRPKWSWPR